MHRKARGELLLVPGPSPQISKLRVVAGTPFDAAFATIRLFA